VREFFRQIVTVEDVQRPKPDPEGLLKILAGRDPAKALYLGDIVDDALSAWAAKIPFIGILPQSAGARSARAALLRKHGAIAVLRDVTQLENWLAHHRA
jgi:phosphoglycolate phosphatase-like HAD superfamily hydrolase